MTVARALTDRLLGEESIWQLLLALKRRASEGQSVLQRCDVALDTGGEIRQAIPGEGWITVRPGQLPVFRGNRLLSEQSRQMLELYLPLCVGPLALGWTVAHVGQSLDGYIAVHGGESRYITGREDVVHMHRMRALADAVVIGRNTVECDDPRLTTRLVPGNSPTRVVLDPARRLRNDYALFRDDGAPTVVISGAANADMTGSQPEILHVPTDGEGRFPVESIVLSLRARGLRRIFVEGGGITVSEFLRAKALDRIHVTVAPIFLGAGRRGISLPGVEGLHQALRPSSRRFSLGEDVLFDCELSSSIR